jgi:hypothetical protein
MVARNGFGLIVYATQAGECVNIIGVVTSWIELQVMKGMTDISKKISRDLFLVPH